MNKANELEEVTSKAQQLSYKFGKDKIEGPELILDCSGIIGTINEEELIKFNEFLNQAQSKTITHIFLKSIPIYDNQLHIDEVLKILAIVADYTPGCTIVELDPLQDDDEYPRSIQLAGAMKITQFLSNHKWPELTELRIYGGFIDVPPAYYAVSIEWYEYFLAHLGNKPKLSTLRISIADRRQEFATLIRKLFTGSAEIDPPVLSNTVKDIKCLEVNTYDYIDCGIMNLKRTDFELLRVAFPKLEVLNLTLGLNDKVTINDILLEFDKYADINFESYDIGLLNQLRPEFELPLFLDVPDNRAPTEVHLSIVDSQFNGYNYRSSERARFLAVVINAEVREAHQLRNKICFILERLTTLTKTVGSPNMESIQKDSEELYSCYMRLWELGDYIANVHEVKKLISNELINLLTPIHNLPALYFLYTRLNGFISDIAQKAAVTFHVGEVYLGFKEYDMQISGLAFLTAAMQMVCFAGTDNIKPDLTKLYTNTLAGLLQTSDEGIEAISFEKLQESENFIAVTRWLCTATNSIANYLKLSENLNTRDMLQESINLVDRHFHPFASLESYCVTLMDQTYRNKMIYCGDARPDYLKNKSKHEMKAIGVKRLFSPTEKPFPLHEKKKQITLDRWLKNRSSGDARGNNDIDTVQSQHKLNI